MNYHIIELNGKEIKFRLKSKDSIEIERKYGKSVIDLIGDPSMTSVITLLKYMRRGEISNFSDENTYELYDSLVDNNYVMETILTEILYPTLVVSGFLKKEDMDEALANIENKKSSDKNQED